MPFIIFMLLEMVATFEYDYDICGQLTLLQMTCAFWCGYYVSDKPTIFRKSVLLTCIIYMLYINIIDSLFITYDYLIAINAVIFSMVLFFQLNKLYSIKSDKLNPDNVCILFYKPKRGFKHIFISLFGFPVSSFSIVCGNKWARFVSNSNYLEHHDIKGIDDNYIIIDTGVKINDNIRASFVNTLGSKASNCIGLRLRCVNVFSNLLKLMGKKWECKYFDFMPSIYLSRRL